MAIPGADERWENWVQFVGARLVQNFTETGFHLIDTPMHIRTKLEAALSVALEDWDRCVQQIKWKATMLYDSTPLVSRAQHSR